jgi:hypothetical protein
MAISLLGQRDTDSAFLSKLKAIGCEKAFIKQAPCVYLHASTNQVVVVAKGNQLQFVREQNVAILGVEEFLQQF